MRFLILLRKSQTSGGCNTDLPKSGLLNSAGFIKEALEKLFHIETKIEVVVDSNDIDREIHKYKPTHMIAEAIWIPPYKLRELAILHPSVYLITRVHSKTTFLANEGVAMQWIKEYEEIQKDHKNVQIAFNAEETYYDFKKTGFKCVYLPNFYIRKYHRKDHNKDLEDDCVFHESFSDPNAIHIACFGAIRPLKNHLTQAIAAIQYANSVKKTLYFHINSSRQEQGGERPFKNLEALFTDCKHKLIKWPWLSHEDFVKLVRRMDCGMQVSLSESFNIVSADFASNEIPIITSNEVNWLPWLNKTTTGNSRKIAQKMGWILRLRKLSTFLAKGALIFYNMFAYNAWEKYLDKHSEIK